MILEVDGVVKTYEDWASLSGLSEYTIRKRISDGWDSWCVVNTKASINDTKSVNYVGRTFGDFEIYDSLYSPKKKRMEYLAQCKKCNTIFSFTHRDVRTGRLGPCKTCENERIHDELVKKESIVDEFVYRLRVKSGWDDFSAKYRAYKYIKEDYLDVDYTGKETEYMVVTGPSWVRGETDFGGWGVKCKVCGYTSYAKNYEMKSKLHKMRCKKCMPALSALSEIAFRDDIDHEITYKFTPKSMKKIMEFSNKFGVTESTIVNMMIDAFCENTQIEVPQEFKEATNADVYTRKAYRSYIDEIDIDHMPEDISFDELMTIIN